MSAPDPRALACPSKIPLASEGPSTQAGQLVQPCLEDSDAAEVATIWEFAVRAVNMAVSIDPKTNVRDAAFSTVFPA